MRYMNDKNLSHDIPTYQGSLPIDRLDLSKEVPSKPTQKQVNRSREIARQDLPEQLRQIQFHLANAKESLASCQTEVAECDAKLGAIEIALAKLSKMPLSRAVQAKIDDALSQKETQTIERQNWIRQVGRYTGPAKSWTDRYEAFDHAGLKALRAEEQALADINL